MSFEHQTTHCVLHLSIAAPDAKTLPVLVELDNPEFPVISGSVAAFARYIQRQGTFSYAWLTKAVSALGYLRDYYLLVKRGEMLEPGSFKPLLEDFLFAFDHGSVLGWRPASDNKYKLARSAILSYLTFLRGLNSSSLGASDSRFIAACMDSYTSTLHAEKSLLAHTKKRGKKKAAGLRKNIVGLKRYKPFPPWLVQPLIDETKNPRDKLIFALIAYGGRRSSELLHIFLEDFSSDGMEALVHLRHPSVAPMRWRNAAGQTVRGQRREYLQSMFGLIPRTDHGSLPSASGWKGILFDDDSAKTSQMYWIRDAGAYILGLHREYLHTVRARVPRRDHPYYLVNEDGHPLSRRALKKQFDLACGRLERKYGVTLDGYGPHSLRHFYGFYCADVLKISLLLLQKYMGHMQLSSTAIYAHISPETANKALKAAENVARGDAPTPEERADITNQYRRAMFADLRQLSARGTTPFGRLDIGNLQRGLK